MCGGHCQYGAAAALVVAPPASLARPKLDATTAVLQTLAAYDARQRTWKQDGMQATTCMCLWRLQHAAHTVALHAPCGL